MNIVGITACPTGIAHTYMAQEALENAAKKRNHQIKIETQGAMGPENVITVEEVEKADIVLLAVGCAVEDLERFDGKPIIEIEVGDVIKNPEKAILLAEEKNK